MNEDNQNKDLLKDVYKSALRASYFLAIDNPEFIKQSKLRIDKKEDQNIDQTTFRLIRGFKRPNDNYKIYQKKGTVYTKTSGFLCFGNIKMNYTAEINNSKFSLKNGELLYRYIDFNAVSAQLYEKKNLIIIQPEGLQKQRRIEFIPEKNSQQQQQQWTKMLYSVIKQTKGARKHYTYLARKCPDFQTSEHITSSQFELKANTGDIILFRCQHGAARAQRFITNSQFDHVGIILRNKKNQIIIYESTSDEGVGMTPWKDLVKYQWYEQCQKIAWRPLTNQLADYQVNIVEQFVARTFGKKYGINMDKLFQLTSRLQRNKQDDENKTYFCSELVARLYKQLKYIDSEKSSTNYFPVDFSMKGSIKFIKNGVGLGNQKIIAFQTN